MITKTDYIRKFKAWASVYPNQFDQPYEHERRFQFHLAFSVMMRFVEALPLPDEADNPNDFCAPILKAIQENKEIKDLYYKQLEIPIYKSACLARLIYGGEELRTKLCPVHNGRWSFMNNCCDDSGFLKD